MSLIDYAYLASNILKNNTKYQTDKNIISSIFGKTINIENKIIARLSVIDSFYSTQMNKRLWGIEEISASINNLSVDDNEIKNFAIKFANNPSIKSPIYSLIIRGYGYSKNGQPFGKASSLVTKYLYFITNYQFPIYDSLVKISYGYFQEKFPDFNLSDLGDDCDIDFFHSINALKNVTSINNYDLLDNLLWLFGKIKSGSFSSMFSKEVYLQFVNLAGVNNFGNDVDQALRIFLQQNINDNQVVQLLGNDFIEFFSFCFDNNGI